MELYLYAVYGKTNEEWAYNHNIRLIIHEKCFGCKHVYSLQGDHDASLCCSLASPYTNQLKALLSEVINGSTGTSNYQAIMTGFIAKLREFNCIHASIMDCNADDCQHKILGVVVETIDHLHHNSGEVPCDNEWRGKLIDLLGGLEIKRQNAQTPQPDDASWRKQQTDLNLDEDDTDNN